MGICAAKQNLKAPDVSGYDNVSGKAANGNGVNVLSPEGVSISSKSSDANRREHPLGLPHGHEVTDASPISLEEIKSRILCGSEKVTVPGKADGGLDTSYSIRYAFVSQRGLYPEDMHKPNQDSFTIIENFANDERKVFFGVFDGHGKDGDLASYYAKEKIPTMLARYLAKAEKKSRARSPGKKVVWDRAVQQKAHTSAFVETNEEICKQPVFDTAMSGTTAVTATVTGRNVFICNCGDSRAVLAVKQADGSLAAQPLTYDQTPHRIDELERCKKAGAHVCNMAQLEGDEPPHEDWAIKLGEEIDDGGDPPRLFLPNEMYPGVAFTRSIGDYVAQSIGCFAEPETESIRIEPKHKFMVLASDGVWEFITNQEVIDIMDKCANPLEACRVIVNKSYNEWLNWETRTDDITVIALWFDGVTSEDASLNQDVKTNLTDARARVGSQMHLHRKESRHYLGMEVSAGSGNRAKSRRGTLAIVQPPDSSNGYKLEDHRVKKTDQEATAIKAMVQDNFLFQHLSEKELDDIASIVEPVKNEVGDKIIRQGEFGDKFYMAETGKFDVFVNINGKETKVHEYDAQGVDSNAYFGDLALLHGVPRAATVVCTKPGTLWSLDRTSFWHMLLNAEEQQVLRLLRCVTALGPLTQAQLERLSCILETRHYADKEIICKEGDIANKFYVVRSGSVALIRDGKELSRGLQFFGERALRTKAELSASVMAIGETTCLEVSQELFEENLGKMSELIREDEKRKEKNKMRREEVTKNEKVVSAELSVFARTKKVRKSLTMLKPDMIDRQDCILRDESDVKERRDLHSSSRLFSATFSGRKYALKTVSTSGFGLLVDSVTASVGKEQKKKDTDAIKVAKARRLKRALDECIDLEVELSCLACPYIANVLAVMRDKEEVSVLLDVIPSMSFHSFLENKPVSESLAKFYCAQLIAIVEQLGASNVICRALAPEYMLLDEAGLLKIHDFRLAKRTDEMERTYTLCGSPDYVAPEQILGRGHSFEVDVWAVGVLTYVMLEGKGPFRDNENTDVMKMYSHIAKHRTNGSKSIDFSRFSEKSKFSVAAQDFVSSLMHETRGQRAKAFESIRKHDFLKGTNWSNVIKCKGSAAKTPEEGLARITK
eukprot:g5617.t1